MNKFFKFIVIILMLFCLCSIGYAYDNSGHYEHINNLGYVPAQLLVGMKNPISLSGERGWSNIYETLFPGLDIRSISDLTDKSRIIPENKRLLSGSVNVKSNSYKNRQILLVELYDTNKLTMLEAIKDLEENPLVAYAEPNLIGSACRMPNDPRFIDLWGMIKIDTLQAWDISTGNSDVVVGVMDSGVFYSHPDLIDNVDEFLGYNFLCDNPAWWYDNPDPMDDFYAGGHGSHVAGTIGAIGDNDEGVVGVCWDTTIVPLKIWDSHCEGSEAEFIAAITYANELEIPISILNISGGWNNYLWPEANFQALYDVVEGYSGLLIASAGNDSHNNDCFDGMSFFPASFDLKNIISVAATDQNDCLCDFSNYGEISVDLAAPGANILSTVYYYGFEGKMPDYDYYQGTSMAAPHVTGAAALLKSYNPNLTPAQIKDAILQTVDICPDLDGTNSLDGKKKVASGGRLNVYKALKYVMNMYSGKINYQQSPRPATVTLYDINQNPIDSAQADTNGNYTLTAPPGTGYTLEVTKPGYCSYTINNLPLTLGEDIEAINIMNLAGDVNGDGFVNAQDLVYLLFEFNRVPVTWQYTDIDGNGVVNAVDLTYMLACFNKVNVVVEYGGSKGGSGGISYGKDVPLGKSGSNGDPGISFTLEAVGNDIYKLVATVTASSTIGKICVTSLAMSFDNTVIAPVHKNTGQIVAGPLVHQSTPFKTDEECNFAGVMWEVLGENTAFDVSPYNALGLDFSLGVRVLEFYFTLQAGKTIADVDADTFAMAANLTNHEYSAMLGGKQTGIVYYYGTPGGNDTVALTSFNDFTSNSYRIEFYDDDQPCDNYYAIDVNSTDTVNVCAIVFDELGG
ncbi:MAG: S8 family serine peptidase, partial [Clostridiales bacterium]|nr:S8 family serine peptidase [Clostridiales bacterium]